MSRRVDIPGSVRELLEDLDLFKLPVVPEEVYRRLGVGYSEAPYEGLEGSLLVVGDRQIIGVNSSRDASRKAFTCAHELGHYYFDIEDSATSFSCSDNDISGLHAGNLREFRANEFAAELLMPESLIGPLMAQGMPSWEFITELANRCGTSI
jgi:Zn-dependent peptidase ImmA (M78 family)